MSSKVYDKHIYFERNVCMTLSDDFKKIAQLPRAVIGDMLRAEANIIAAAQRKTAEAMKVRDTGEMIRSITVGPHYYGKGKHGILIEFKGGRTRSGIYTPNTEIAFWNEYGVMRGGFNLHRYRPFVRTANEQKAGEAERAAYDIYDKYLREHDL